MAREVPKMEFENTVIALLDGKEFYRTNVGGEEDHKAIDQKLDAGVYPRSTAACATSAFNATAGQHKVAVTFLRRSYAESDERVRPNTLDGGQQRVKAVHAFQIKGPIKVTGISDSPSRREDLHLQARRARPRKRPAPSKIIANLARARLPPPGDGRGPAARCWPSTSKGRQAGPSTRACATALAAILASPHFLYRAEAASDTRARR